MYRDIKIKSPLEYAYRVGREIMASRDGAGFRFNVTLNNGTDFDVCPLPDDDLEFPHKDVFGNEIDVWFWSCELANGNPIVIRHSEIAAIEVVEC